MPKVVCPDCGGYGEDNAYGGDHYGPCTRCGGSRTEKVGLFGGRSNIDKKGSGYITVSNKDCPNCGGRGRIKISISDEEWANMRGEAKIGLRQTQFVKCSSCEGIGKVP